MQFHIENKITWIFCICFHYGAQIENCHIRSVYIQEKSTGENIAGSISGILQVDGASA